MMMNDIEKAIQEIHELKENISPTDDKKNAINLAVQSLEKQIPKKVVSYSQQNTGTKKCYVCGRIFAIWEEKYCHNCGQKQDWSDSE